MTPLVPKAGLPAELSDTMIDQVSAVPESVEVFTALQREVLG